MADLVPIGQVAPVDDTDLFSRAASIYCDLQDERPGKAVRLDHVWDRLHAESPDRYDDATRRFCIDRLRSKEFSDVMLEKRQTRLMCTLGAQITAGEIGFALGMKASEELTARLESEPEAISTKDLIALAKAGFDLTQRAAPVAGREGEGSPSATRVAIDTVQVLIGLPPERRAVIANELGRQFLAEVNQGESE